MIPTSLYASKRIQRLAKLRSEFVGSELEFEIEASKDHWSELSPELLNGALAGQQDLKKAQQQQIRSGSVDNGRVDGKNAKPRSCGRVVKEFCGYLRIVSRKKNDGSQLSLLNFNASNELVMNCSVLVSWRESNIVIVLIVFIKQILNFYYFIIFLSLIV